MSIHMPMHKSRHPASLRYATAVALAALCVHTPANAASDALAIQGMVPAASQGKAAREARMRRCLQSWDPATQMSKREWKRSCQRVIIEQPGLYGPDPL